MTERVKLITQHLSSEALRKSECLQDPCREPPSDEVAYKQLKGHTIALRILIHFIVKQAKHTKIVLNSFFMLVDQQSALLVTHILLWDIQAQHYLLFIQANRAAKKHFQKAFYNFLSPLMKIQLIG